MPVPDATDRLEAAVAEYRRAEVGAVPADEMRRLRAAIDSLEADFSAKAKMFQVGGGHLAEGATSVMAWIRNNCNMSGASAADRLCVGKELESLPRIARALSSGQIGYQSAAVLCHLREQLEDKRDLFDEDEMLDMARRHTVAELRLLCRYARYAADPDGFCRDEEERFDRRRAAHRPEGRRHASDRWRSRSCRRSGCSHRTRGAGHVRLKGRPQALAADGRCPGRAHPPRHGLGPSTEQAWCQASRQPHHHSGSLEGRAGRAGGRHRVLPAGLGPDTRAFRL